jgi:DNA-binding MarR family transcriptional regulator
MKRNLPTRFGDRRRELTATKKTGGAGHKSWPLDQRPGYLIRRLHQIHVSLFQDACADYEMTPLQYSLLSALAVRGTADQTTLASDIALDRTTTTGALKRLELRKLVERPVSDDDRRARVCRLTAVGAALLTRIEGAAREAHRETLAPLSRSEQEMFVAMMHRIVAAEGDQAEAC